MAFNGVIADIVPHDSPMVLLDKFLSASDDGLIAEVHITEGSPFYVPAKGVPAYVGVEYIAQAISAFNGLSDFLQDKEVKLGFLLGSRKVDLKCSYFPLGSILEVSVNVSFNDGEMAVFDGQITLENEVVVTGRINAFQPDDPTQFIQSAQNL